MILDEQNLFSDNQAITATAASDNILNLGKREISFATPVELFIQVTETFDQLTDLTIAVQSSDKEDFSSPVTLIEQNIQLDDLVKGKVSSIKFLPKGNLGYVRLYYTVNGTEPSKGKIFAGIVDGNQESFHNI